MINGTLLRAGRARLVAIRRGTAEQDGGFALAFVLLVTTMITLAVAATLAVTAPNIHNARDDQSAQAALAAAQAGVDDALAWITGHCLAATSACMPHARGTGQNVSPIALPGTAQTFSWSAQSVDSGKSIRVSATGTADHANRSLVADLSRSRSILSFGYYSDHESQSPAYLSDYFASRSVYLASSTAYSQIDALNTSNHAISVTAPTTANWAGPPLSGSNPNPASMCGQHWYAEPGSAGRYSYGSDSVWGEKGTITSNSLIRSSSCDLVFTTGMTFDGPVYTRDALLISDKTAGGAGPIFKQPVYSMWGYQSGTTSYNTPIAPTATPWRKDSSVGGTLSSASQKPQVAPFDITLPKDIGSEGLPDNACIYTGPTRIKLNGSTATVTSPQTTARAASSDSNCYPSGSLAGGIVSFPLTLGAGSGAVYVQNALADGDSAPTVWPSTGTKSTIPATPTNSVFYLSSPAGGTATPGQPDSAVAPDSSCSTSSTYAAVPFYTCAWTNVAKTGDVGTGSGWSAYSSTTKCSQTIAATDRELFECEYSHTTGGSTPSPSNRYGALRTQVQSDLASTCTTGTVAALDTCLTSELQSRLQTANTSQHAAGYASPTNRDHQYVVTKVANGSAGQGAAKSVGSAPTPPLNGDPLFASASTPAQEAPTGTPISLTVSRQTYGCIDSSGSIISQIGTLLSGLLGCASGSNPGWGNSTPQFTITATQSHWNMTSQASGASYFPDTKDVTQYNASNTGAHGTDYPGDLYVEGTNSGRLSLLAQNDVVVTGDLTDTSSDPKVAAIDLVAGNNVRNFHPVQCADQTAADITKTSAGWCPNDITGLYRGASGMENNGVLTSAHPAMQYTNLTLPGQSVTCASDTQVGARRIDAAVFTLSGSLLTDNYNRGCQLGPLTVNGGLYQSHRGANGVQWEAQTGDTKRATSGYSLQYHYVDLENSDLPFTPATGGNGWKIVSLSGSGS